MLHKTSYPRLDDVRCSKVDHVVRYVKKQSIYNIWMIVFLLYKTLCWSETCIPSVVLYYPAEVQLPSRDTFCFGLDFRIAWRSAALRQDELSVLANYRRLQNVMQLTCTTWMQSDIIPNDSIRKTHSSCQNMCFSLPCITVFRLIAIS